MLLEVFEWVDDQAFERAQQNPQALECWGGFESLWIDGGFGVERFPEAKLPWAQFASIA